MRVAFEEHRKAQRESSHGLLDCVLGDSHSNGRALYDRWFLFLNFSRYLLICRFGIPHSISS